jgi:hypothetical protein
MSFAPPTGQPVTTEAPDDEKDTSYMIGDWKCNVYLHPTKKTSVKFVAKHTKRPIAINTDLFASQLATFDPDEFWRNRR